MTAAPSKTYVHHLSASVHGVGETVDYQHGPPSAANLSTVWKISGADPTAGSYATQYAANPVLLRPIAAPEYRNLYFGAGFYCVTPCNTFVFGVYAVSTVNQSDAYKLNANANSVMLVWSANRDHQVQKNATLNFTGDGDLILRDADGSLVWSSGTSGRSVVGMNMTESGNVVLFDQDNKSVWQSFDHPVDSLLPGQRLLVGKSLTPNRNTGVITDEESCKQTCLGNCSCKAALFRYGNDASNGSCLLASESLSLVGSSMGQHFSRLITTRRPQMSVVVKVLEGTMNVETNIEYNFVTMVATSLGNAGKLASSGPLLASHLSGPR
ncbi:hypothetical protein PR202_ga24111 [Eleusine coracana subsp. coracana]|uniref:non-specific serine/threonine protein kinase n=1 Tax=Eleusine coracana subsp. coracana TaxID=191504 RepID=A0AAV5D8L4_ELECO|nr:hypothetical protein PR202_ga24111 [Eleusine coracana subsp. coracana]